MTRNKIKVLIVDDSALIRSILRNLLEQDPNIKVAGNAVNGLDALKKARELKPDVIILDIEMPVMDGITCFQNLKRQGRYGVIIISGHSKEVINATIRGLEDGAIDFISKPDNVFDISPDEIIEKVKLAYKAQKAEEQNSTLSKHRIERADIAPNDVDLKYIIAIGISTGGPKALATILPEFPANLPAAIVIVQHMPPGFTGSLAARLNELCQLKVKEAEDGDELKAGYAYIAPGNYHLTFKSKGDKTFVVLDQSPAVGGFRPNADVMMTSLAQSDNKNIIGVIMTGMGSDGSKGLMELKKKKNAYIVAQDESSSIVFGMPRSAIELGIVDKTVPLKEIPACIMNFMGVRY
ncbi:MAG: chemotaxis response regulator protein-glutamate methylesterase [Clostridiaceae bacterium]|nr:chemotaxis response regulator protein-glutamate methylesterase [Clostridiaceae bacterium]